MKPLGVHKVTFAKLDGVGYMAGVTLDDILKDAANIYDDLKVEKIEEVDYKKIPKEYKWSAARTMLYDDWCRQGTFLLIKNFEKSHSFSEYFPGIDQNKVIEEK